MHHREDVYKNYVAIVFLNTSGANDEEAAICLISMMLFCGVGDASRTTETMKLNDQFRFYLMMPFLLVFRLTWRKSKAQ
jgi:glycopeptide antibiotics resistance protein